MRTLNKEYKYMYVYITTNILNNKIYIGLHRTNNIKDGYKGSGKLLLKAIKKYGAVNFKTEILYETKCNQDLIDKEIHYISFYKSNDLNIGYNLSLGGEGQWGLKWSPEIYEKKCTKVAQYDLEGRFIKFYISSYQAAREVKGCTPANISKCVEGVYDRAGLYMWKKYTDCKNIAPYEDKRACAIHRYTLDGTYLDSFKSCREAGRKLNISSSSISAACRGIHKQIGGFKWKYLSDYELNLKNVLSQS